MQLFETRNALIGVAEKVAAIVAIDFRGVNTALDTCLERSALDLFSRLSFFKLGDEISVTLHQISEIINLISFLLRKL